MKRKAIVLILIVCILMPVSIMPARAVSSLFVAACDINGDGRVTAADARLVLRRAARLEFPDKTLAAIDAGIRVFGDMNGSGGVTSADARLLLGYVSRMVGENVFTFSLLPVGTEPSAVLPEQTDAPSGTLSAETTDSQLVDASETVGGPTSVTESETVRESAVGENTTRDDLNELVDETTARATVPAPPTERTTTPGEELTELVDDPANPGGSPVSAVIISEGVDISHHNGYINWEVMKERVDWVILRCGYGGDFPEQDDLRWEYNASRCDELGIPYGVYLYSYADTVEKAVSEADHALRLLKGHYPQLPVYYDLEEDGIARRVPKTRFLEMSKAFCEKITEAGFEFGVYANLNWWNNILTDPWFDGYSRWMAVYRDVFVYDGVYDIWQYTSTGKIEGFNGVFDLNHAYRPFDLQPRPHPTAPPEPATAPPEPATVPPDTERTD